MNFYEKRIKELDKKTLPSDVFGDGRERNHVTNEDIWKNLKVGDKIYPTVWFLRNIDEVKKVKEIAENGLTIIEKGFIDDSEGKWGLGGWQTARFNALWFEETKRLMSFKVVISQQIWKINDKKL